ncbi:hypothetical protein BGW38_008280 [Lunasporangiospora selenospora]|uniref:Uncharacterized protein n=1 Tax=Lunasporangiospora selenospora TaxID=979761 RepID=A0A9P6FY35_9FUNG|nr:hypothetical protein BGW38_008280 [Lunasporangiospora selenospora]
MSTVLASTVLVAIALAQLPLVHAQNGDVVSPPPGNQTSEQTGPTTGVSTPIVSSSSSSSSVSNTPTVSTASPSSSSSSSSSSIPTSPSSSTPSSTISSTINPTAPSSSIPTPPPTQSSTRPIDTSTRPTNPHTSTRPTLSGSNTVPSIRPTDGTSSSSSTTNVPAIVGSIAGVAALGIIIAITLLCYRRRRRHQGALSFDALQGLSSSTTSKNRNSLNYLTGPSPTIGHEVPVSITSGPGGRGGNEYDDGYGYEAGAYAMQQTAGHPAYHPGGYGEEDLGYHDGYVASAPYPQSHQMQQQGAYRVSPTIFQEDFQQHTSAGYGAAGHGRAAYDQTLPEVMYNNGDPAVSAAYYNDGDLYSQAWDPSVSQSLPQPSAYTQSQDAGYWPAETQYDHPQISAAAAAATTVTAAAATAAVYERDDHQASKNPQALPDSPILSSTKLRGGDLFGQDGEHVAASPRMAQASSAQATASPVLRSASPVVRSSTPNRDRPSIDAHPGHPGESYAADFTRPSTDGRAPGKSLRTLRREDWS